MRPYGQLLNQRHTVKEILLIASARPKLIHCFPLTDGFHMIWVESNIDLTDKVFIILPLVWGTGLSFGMHELVLL